MARALAARRGHRRLGGVGLGKVLSFDMVGLPAFMGEEAFGREGFWGYGVRVDGRRLWIGREE